MWIPGQHQKKNQAMRIRTTKVSKSHAMDLKMKNRQMMKKQKGRKLNLRESVNIVGGEVQSANVVCPAHAKMLIVCTA